MKIVFLFYDGMTALDVIGPHEILSRLPKITVLRTAPYPGLIHTSSELSLTAEHGIANIPHADVLVVPGSGNATALRQYPEILKWIRLIHSTTIWTASVCTGSLILGAAGILVGMKATSHWAALDRLKRWKAYPTKARVVVDGKIVTAAGVSAGIDMALVLAEKLAGHNIAQAIQLNVEYDPAPPFDVGSPEKADPLIREALRKQLEARFENIDE